MTSFTLNGCSQPTPNMTTATNPLLCDPDTGVCAVPGMDAGTEATLLQPKAAQTKSITLLYFTDPICSSCWGAEPQLRRLKAEYGDAIDIQYHMGGLLPSWDVYNSGGISKPSDVAGHWDEVSPHYRMPIIGDVWLEDPLPSSYPPSIAFKAAQLQDPAKALVFLRRLREQVLVEKKNITKWAVIRLRRQVSQGSMSHGWRATIPAPPMRSSRRTLRWPARSVCVASPPSSSATRPVDESSSTARGPTPPSRQR